MVPRNSYSCWEIFLRSQKLPFGRNFLGRTNAFSKSCYGRRIFCALKNFPCTNQGYGGRDFTTYPHFSELPLYFTAKKYFTTRRRSFWRRVACRAVVDSYRFFSEQHGSFRPQGSGRVPRASELTPSATANKGASKSDPPRPQPVSNP